MTVEAALSVRLTLARGRVADVALVQTRPVRAANVLAGRTPRDLLRALPLLFPVCGFAHGVACARALEGAFCRTTDPRLEAARDLACLGEAAASHVWQLAITWHEAAGLPPDIGSVRAARHAFVMLCGALFADRELSLRHSPGDGRREATRAAQALAALLNALTLPDAPLLAAVRSAGRAGFGASRTPTFAALPVEEVGARLASDRTFAESPEIDEAPIDLSAYARQRTSEAVRAAERDHPGALLARLVARRADARAVTEALATSLANLDEEVCVPPLRATAGAAQTARGPLVYWARATPEKVDEVRMVAPTDWTFHPRGVLRDALLGSEAGATLVRDVGWLIVALDPCVPWSIEVRDA